MAWNFIETVTFNYVKFLKSLGENYVFNRVYGKSQTSFY
jgi:hypothetical protein